MTCQDDVYEPTPDVRKNARHHKLGEAGEKKLQGRTTMQLFCFSGKLAMQLLFEFSKTNFSYYVDI